MRRLNEEKHIALIFIGFLILLGVFLFFNLQKQYLTREEQLKLSRQILSEEVRTALVNVPYRLILIEDLIAPNGDVEQEYQYDSARFSPDEIREVLQLISKENGLRLKSYQLEEDSGVLSVRIAFHTVPIGTFRFIPRPRVYLAKLGIIIDDFGYFYNETIREFLTLPFPVTFSIIPGHTFSKKIARGADKAGYDVMIHMPMEPINYEGGEEGYILKVGMSGNEIKNRIFKAFREIPMAVGMNNHQGSRFTSDLESMKKAARVIKGLDIFFIDSYTSSNSVAYRITRNQDIPNGIRHIFLDNQSDEVYIKGQLNKLKDLALQRGSAVAIGHNRPETLRVLREEIPRAIAEGFNVVPVKDLVE
jgi:polysaccharide deacetylase 2 family uncharacterized protein YibQ